VAILICHHEVQFAVSVQVSYSQPGRVRPHDLVHCGLEGAIPVSEEHAEVVAAVVRNHQVLLSV